MTQKNQKKMEENKQISKTLLAFDALVVISIVGIVFMIYSVLHPAKKTEAEQKPLTILHTFDTLPIEAKSAYVFDISKNTVIYQKNPDVQLPLASITKLTMALTASNLLARNSHIT